MGRSRHHTGWAGALAVAAELSRREYDAAITLGNTPTLDLICSSPGGVPFKVQVKSVTSGNWVLIRKSFLEDEPKLDLFLAVVLVPARVSEPFEFHILTHEEASRSYTAQRRVRRDGQPYRGGMEGLAWTAVRQHRNQWNKLPR
jgi:hypothetical protein